MPSKTLMMTDAQEYLVIRMVQDTGATTKTTLWIDTARRLPRKVSAQTILNGLTALIAIVTFSNYGLARDIEEPEWLTTDQNDVITRTDVRAVEHW